MCVCVLKIAPRQGHKTKYTQTISLLHHSLSLAVSRSLAITFFSFTLFTYSLTFVTGSVCLPDCVLAFHTHGLQGRSFANNEIVQEITDPSRRFKVIGADQIVVLESRPDTLRASSSSASVVIGSPSSGGDVTTAAAASNLYILTGHENSF